MSTETKSISSGSFSPAPPTASRAVRVWPAIVLIMAYWALFVTNSLMETTISAHFFTSVIGPGVLFLLFLIWWLSNRGMRLADRLAGFAAVVAGCAVATLASDKSIGLFVVLMYAVPMGLTLWTIWLMVGGRRSVFVQRWGPALALAPFWIGYSLIRMNGLDGDLHADLHWRWTPSPEELLIVERAQSGEKLSTARPAAVPTESLVLQPGDWPGLRGPQRNGEVHGEPIATDWDKSPPKQLWRAKIGPAWSSFVVLGDRLFTQEQRGENEGVVCLDGATGKEIWVHLDKARYWDSQGGAGPRGTPTFDAGRIYTLGATGILNCLDAATGESKWSQNIATDAKIEVPMWGLCSSPLVTDGMVIVYAGGTEKGLLGYHAADGKLAWTAPTGTSGYSSPQLAVIGGRNQVLSFDDNGVGAVDPTTGAVLWRHAAAAPHMWRAVQPHLLGDSQVLIGSEDLGLVSIEVKQGAPNWSATRQWTSDRMKPAYNDFVVQDGYIYGFNEAIFCCLDAASGKQVWKGGHYGHGQVLLLADQRLLLVLGEKGEVALLTANPKKLEELGKFQALEQKTWNHPVVAHGRLFVRNDQEMACYQLAPIATK